MEQQISTGISPIGIHPALKIWLTCFIPQLTLTRQFRIGMFQELPI